MFCIFVKQKTAYEMRISDWSSDVCSSDLQEWAYNQAAARLVEADDQERFSLSPEARIVLATPGDPAFGMGMFHHLPETLGALSSLPESFRTGVGRDYDAQGEAVADGIARRFEPVFGTHLVPPALPSLAGLLPKPQTGALGPDLGR